MAADNALLAMALMNQQRQGSTPEDRRAKYAQLLMQQGASTAPVQSPLEGLARALQGGVGGYLQGRQESATQDDMQALQRAATATSEDEFKEALKGISNASGLAGPILGQLAMERQAQIKRSEAAKNWDAGQGMPGAPAVAPVPTVPQGSQDVPTGAAPGGSPSPDRAAFIQQMTPHVLNISQQTGLDPRLVMSKIALETGWGQSAPGNNYFGIKAQPGEPSQVLDTKEAGPGGQLMPTQAAFRTFPDVGAASQGYVDFLKNNQRYQPLLQAQGFDAQLQALGKSGYATDPNYVPKIQQIAQTLPPFGGAGPQVAQGDNTQVAQAGTPRTGDPITAPPEPPLRPLPPHRQNYYRKAIEQGNLTPDQASKESMAEMEKNREIERSSGKAVWEQEQQRRQGEEKAIQELQQAGPMAVMRDRIKIMEEKTRPKAEAAANDINAIHTSRQLLDAGAFTGAGANAQMALGKMAEVFGIRFDSTANTQVLGSTLANRVISGLGGSLGSGFSNADRDFFEKAKGGQVTWTEDSLRKLFDIGERESRNTLKNYDAEVGRVLKGPGMKAYTPDFFGVPKAQTYEEFNAANPRPQAAPQQGAPQAGQPQIQDGTIAVNPQTKQRKVFRGGQWVDM